MNDETRAKLKILEDSIIEIVGTLLITNQERDQISEIALRHGHYDIEEFLGYFLTLAFFYDVSSLALEKGDYDMVSDVCDQLTFIDNLQETGEFPILTGIFDKSHERNLRKKRGK